MLFRLKLANLFNIVYSQLSYIYIRSKGLHQCICKFSWLTHACFRLKHQHFRPFLLVLLFYWLRQDCKNITYLPCCALMNYFAALLHFNFKHLNRISNPFFTSSCSKHRFKFRQTKPNPRQIQHLIYFFVTFSNLANSAFFVIWLYKPQIAPLFFLSNSDFKVTDF